MAPVIWGLDLKEMQWGKFKSSYMFGNKDYYKRRTKFVVYQLAMIFCIVSESLGTDVLSDYNDSQKYLSQHSGGRAVEHNNDYVGMASYNIWAGVFVAFIFGSAFFFDLFWPERHEDRGIRMAWKGCSIMACVFMFISIILEVVIVSTRVAYVTGVSSAEAKSLLEAYGGYPLTYNQNSRAIAGVVFAWLGFPFVVYSTIIMWMSIDHIEKHGPFTAHAAAERKLTGNESNGASHAPSAEKGDGHELSNMEEGRTNGAGTSSKGPMQSPAGDVTYPGT